MKARDTFRERLYIIIFGTDTVAGKRFDIALLWLIVLSTVAVMLESVPDLAVTDRAPGCLVECLDHRDCVDVQPHR